MAAPFRKTRPWLHLKLLYCSHNFLKRQRQNNLMPRCRRLSTKSNVLDKKPCLFSGIQPTGVPHLGNYLGAISQWVELQKQCDTFLISIVDLHSITVPQRPSVLRDNIRDMAICLLACGIDPDKTILFQQSMVEEHAVLGWMLGCLTTMPRLQHLPQWKEKSSDGRDVGVGLFTYPVLQSADILLYRASHVPVGDDQVKHIELARDLAKIFNKKFGSFFPTPKPLVGDFKRLKSLRNPLVKMSKSDSDSKSRIELTDSPDSICEKIKKAVTDSDMAISYDPTTRPGLANLIDIHAALEDTTAEEICEDNMFQGKLPYKNQLTDIIIERLSPIRNEIEKLKDDKQYVEDVLHKGHKKAKELAAANLARVKELVGLS